MFQLVVRGSAQASCVALANGNAAHQEPNVLLRTNNAMESSTAMTAPMSQFIFAPISRNLIQF